MLKTMPQELQTLAAMLADEKRQLLADFGVGAELDPQVVAFDAAGRILGRAEMKVGVESHIEQYENLIYVASLMRSGWHASSIAMCMEGYMALQMKERSSSTSLAELFATNDQNVLECLTIVWCSETQKSAVYSVPYRIGLGRSVDFMDNEARGVINTVTGPYQDGLRRVFDEITLTEMSAEVPQELYLFSVAIMINKSGFDVESSDLADLTNWIKKNKKLR